MQNNTVEIIGVYQLEKDDIKDFDDLVNPENAETDEESEQSQSEWRSVV